MSDGRVGLVVWCASVHRPEPKPAPPKKTSRLAHQERRERKKQAVDGDRRRRMDPFVRKTWGRMHRDLNKALGRLEMADIRMERRGAGMYADMFAMIVRFGMDAELDVAILRRGIGDIRSEFKVIEPVE